MTGEQMLDKLGVTPEEAQEYNLRVSSFKESLTDPLRSLYEKTHIPVPVAVVRELFGLDVTQSDLEELYKAAPGLDRIIILSNIDRHPPRG